MSFTEQDVKAMYPDADPQYPYRGSYDPIIARIVPDVFVREDVGSYQGDTFVFGRDLGGVWVWLEIGWGSCSGCDALQACSTVKDVAELAQSISSGAKRFDHLAEALDYFQNHDWKGDWSSDEKKAVVTKVTAVLEAETARSLG
jgi:hypothetical protein